MYRYIVLLLSIESADLKYRKYSSLLEISYLLSTLP